MKLHAARYSPEHVVVVPGMLAGLLFLCLLFCQLGVSPLASAATLGLFLQIMITRSLRINYRILIFVAVSLSSYVIFVLVHQRGGEVLREIRILVLGVLYFYLLDGKSFYFGKSQYVSAFLLSLLALLCFAQFVGLKYGYSVVVPAYFFANNADPALAFNGLQLAMDGGYEFRYRPSVFYSEPSYYGLVITSLLYLILRSELRYQNFFIIVAVAGVLFSQTLLGLMGVLIVIFLRYEKRIKLQFLVPIFAILMIFMLLVVGEGAQLGGLWSRFYAVVSLDDVSTMIRFIQPLQVIGDVFISSPFGVPMSELYDLYLQKGFYGIYDSAPFHNGFLNMFMVYGILAPVILMLMFTALRDVEERVLLLIFMVQNGGFFSFDKIFLFTLIVLLSRAATSQKGMAVMSPMQSYSSPRSYLVHK